MNRKQYITRAEALVIAERIRKGEKLKAIAKEQGRDYSALCQYMNGYGLGVQALKRRQR